MSNQEQSQINPISQSTSTELPLHDCLQSSLEFRLAHRARVESSVEEDAIEETGASHTDASQPEVGSLICDAPLGLKR